MEIISTNFQFQMPEDTGDTYLLFDYPNYGMTTLGFACKIPDPLNEARQIWAIEADDGDYFVCRDPESFKRECPAKDVILLRRVFDGIEGMLGAYFPESYATAMRYRFNESE